MIDLLLAAIMMVESRGNDHAVGDGGLARGPYQIHRDYWADAVEQLHREGHHDFVKTLSYDQDVESREICRTIVRAYWRRYCPAALALAEGGSASALETLARVHNGGPRGMVNRRTQGYWVKVRREMGSADCGVRNAE